MKKGVIAILLLWVMGQSSALKACSCVNIPICEMVHSDQFNAVVLGHPVGYVEYSEQNRAFYLEVEEVIAANEPITDTIKLYGNVHGASCDISVDDWYASSDQLMIWVISYSTTEYLVNPDSTTESYTEFDPDICNSRRLLVENGKVEAWISGAFSKSYSLAEFRSAISNCIAGAETGCFTVGSVRLQNPVPNGPLRVWSTDTWPTLQAIRVFAQDGRLVHEEFFIELIEIPAILEIGLLPSGFYVVELVCEEARDHFKVVVQ